MSEAKLSDSKQSGHHQALTAAWSALMTRLEWGEERELYTQIIEAYDGPKRGYHDSSHLAAVITALMGRLTEAKDPEALLLAAWFHDLYPPWKGGAERKSADQALTLLRARGLSEERLKRIDELIMATADHLNAAGADARLLVDADIWILGAPSEVYQRYVSGVRREYSHVPKPLFKMGRRRFISAMLKAAEERGQLSFALGEAWERQALENLRGELEAPSY